MKNQVYYLTALLVFIQYGLGALWGSLVSDQILLVVGLFFIGISLLQLYLLNTLEIIFVKYLLGFGYFFYWASFSLQQFLFQYREMEIFNPYILYISIFMFVFSFAQLYMMVLESKGYHDRRTEKPNYIQTRFFVIPSLLVILLYSFMPVLTPLIWGVMFLLSVGTVILYEVLKLQIVRHLKYALPGMYFLIAGLIQLIRPESNFMMFPITIVNYLHVFVFVPISLFMMVFLGLYENGKINPNKLKNKMYVRTTISDVKERNIDDIIPPRRRRIR